MIMEIDLEEFLAERDEALRSLDIEKVIAVYGKWNPEMDADKVHRRTAEIGMHKARVHCLSLSDVERAYSKGWLEGQNYSPLIG
jgi:hypothetical protein